MGIIGRANEEKKPADRKKLPRKSWKNHSSMRTLPAARPTPTNDDDKVESSNLHRQILHNLKKVGMLKTNLVKEAILAVNPNVQIETHSIRMTRENAVQIVENYDFVIDATDNLLTRYIINDACVVDQKVELAHSPFFPQGLRNLLHEPVE